MAVFTGRRIRDNNVQGIVDDNPLSDVALTLNSSALTNLSAISGNHAVIVLDPLRTAGAPEIVIVTAHTGSATSATITRGAYGTTPREHDQGTPWVHPATDADLIEILAADPSDFYEGQLWYRADTDIFMAHDGTSAVEALPIGAWQTWTPTFTNLTLNSGTIQARYTRIGRTVLWRLEIRIATDTSVGGAPRFTLPVAYATAGDGSRDFVANFMLFENGGDSVIGYGSEDSGGVRINACAVSGTKVIRQTVSATVPFTWGDGDSIIGNGFYEAT